MPSLRLRSLRSRRPTWFAARLPRLRARFSKRLRFLLPASHYRQSRRGRESSIISAAVAVTVRPHDRCPRRRRRGSCSVRRSPSRDALRRCWSIDCCVGEPSRVRLFRQPPRVCSISSPRFFRRRCSPAPQSSSPAYFVPSDFRPPPTPQSAQSSVSLRRRAVWARSQLRARYESVRRLRPRLFSVLRVSSICTRCDQRGIGRSVTMPSVTLSSSPPLASSRGVTATRSSIRLLRPRLDAVRSSRLSAPRSTGNDDARPRESRRRSCWSARSSARPRRSIARGSLRWRAFNVYRRTGPKRRRGNDRALRDHVLPRRRSSRGRSPRSRACRSFRCLATRYRHDRRL
jgi:hypothetical protein